jgi:hypothetical protein
MERDTETKKERKKDRGARGGSEFLDSDKRQENFDRWIR